jgi:hypothetical protein
VGAKGPCLAGPLRSGETSRPHWGDPVAAWWQDKQGEVID